MLLLVQLLCCVWLCDPMDCSTPGFPVLHCLSEFAQIHVYWVSESTFRIRWSKDWSSSFSPSNECSGLISFRIDWFDILTVQGTLKSLLQQQMYGWEVQITERVVPKLPLELTFIWTSLVVYRLRCHTSAAEACIWSLVRVKSHMCGGCRVEGDKKNPKDKTHVSHKDCLLEKGMFIWSQSLCF